MRYALPHLRIRKSDRVPLGVGIAGMLLMAVRLFVPVPVGMADNNDGIRLLCLIGADVPAVHPGRSGYWHFLVQAYPQQSHQHCEPYPSTMLLPAWLAAFLHRLTGQSGAVDLREFAIEYCVLVGLVLAAAAYLTRSLPKLARFAFLGALFVVLAESTFADYADSPYTETIALWGLAVFVVAGTAALVPHRHRTAAYVVAWLAAAMTVGAKVETLTLVLPLGVFFAVAKAPRRRMRIAVLASLLAMAAWQGGAFGGGPQDGNVNTQNELTMAVMPQADDPGAVAAGLGLPHSLGSYSGSSFWSDPALQNAPGFKADRVTVPRLAIYLAEHPRLAFRVLTSGSGPYYHFRTDNYIGNYTAADGHGSEHHEYRVSIVSFVAKHLEPLGFTGILGYWLGCLGLALWLRRRSRPGTLSRAFAVVSLVLVAGAVVQYLTSVFGEGNEVTKHLAVCLLAATLTPLWLFAAAFAPGRAPYVWNRANATTRDEPDETYAEPDETYAEPDETYAEPAEPAEPMVPLTLSGSAAISGQATSA